MEKETNNNFYRRMPTVLELLDDNSGRYDHLKVIMYRNKESTRLGLGQKYLVINTIGFGVYRLDDVDYSNGKIFLTLTNPDTGNSTEINLDINEGHPEHFLICWNDIKNMVYAESACNVIDDGLLELETDQL